MLNRWKHSEDSAKQHEGVQNSSTVLGEIPRNALTRAGSVACNFCDSLHDNATFRAAYMRSIDPNDNCKHSLCMLMLQKRCTETTEKKIEKNLP